jgi:ubiquinone/menaquinone biosynthesis C-methylase UbiE
MEKTTTRRLNDMGLAFMQAGTLIAAVELKLFDVLAQGPLTLDEIARRIGVSGDRVEKTGSGLRNAPDVERFLVRGKPTYFGGYLVHLAKGSYENWGTLARHLKTAAVASAGRYHATAASPAEARALTEAGYTGSQGTARRLARRFDFSPYRRLLDLGGGSAVYSIEACRQNPALRATLLDVPNVCAVAREFIEKAGLSDRIETVGGDFTADPLPGGADVVLLCGNLHAYDPEAARRVVKKAFDALPAGGAMILCDYMLNGERTGPPVAAFISLSQVFSGGQGRVHSAADFREYLSSAGFRVEKVEEFLEGSMGWATAVRP